MCVWAAVRLSRLLPLTSLIWTIAIGDFVRLGRLQFRCKGTGEEIGLTTVPGKDVWCCSSEQEMNSGG